MERILRLSFALIKAGGGWQNSRLVQHGTRIFDAVTTACFDRLDLAPSCSTSAKRSK